VENRQLNSYDAALPGCGLLIWHIDESLYYDYYANANENHPLVKVMQADGLDELRYAIDPGDAGDPFPGSTSNRNFTLYSEPNSKLYDGKESYVRVTDISDCGATMTADLLYGYPVPTLDTLTPGYSGPSTSSFTLTLQGLDFYSSSVVRWNGSDRTTKYVSGTRLQATITAADMVALGGVGNSASVTVFNPQPGGGDSDPLLYMIIDAAALIPRSYMPIIFHEFEYGPHPGYIIEMHEEFEGIVPGYKWEISEKGSGDYKLTKSGCRPFNGLFSGWVAGGGADGGLLPCYSTYPANMDTAMTYGPFSTEEGILNGEMVFKMFFNTEPARDFLRVTAGIGGASEWGLAFSGNSGGWISGTLNLNNVDGLGTSVIGYPKVWVRFRFTSDYITQSGEGAYIDDIILRVCKTSACSIDFGGSLSPLPGSLISTDDMLVEPIQYSPAE
jgi:hypothetical protein